MKKLAKWSIVSGIIFGIAAFIFSKAEHACFILWKQSDSCPILVAEAFGMFSEVFVVFARIILPAPTNSVPVALIALVVNFALWGFVIGSLLMIIRWVAGRRNGNA